MKTIYTIFILLFSICFSCVEDKGNYDYRELNEITVSGIEARYDATQNYTRLIIDPVIEMTDGDYLDTNRFEYFWLATRNYNSRDTLSYGRKLDYLVDLEPNTYDLNFKIRDRETDIIYMKKSSLVVGNAYLKGILLTGENETGNADFQIISMLSDTIILTDILEKAGLSDLQGPIDFIHTGYINLTNSYRKLWLLTESGGYSLDLLTLEADESKTFRNLVFSIDELPDKLIPVAIAPRIKDNAGTTRYTTNRVVVTTDGHLFAANLTSLSGYYTNPKNRESHNPDKFLKASPYIMYSLNNGDDFLWYDKDNERFMFINAFNEYSTSLHDETGDPFPWNQEGTGRRLIYAENTFDTEGGSEFGNSYSIMQDEQGNSFIYKFYMNKEVPQKIRGMEVKLMATDFNRADFYAFSSNRTILFYAVDNDLYAYDFNVGNEKLYKMEGFGKDKITMLQFDTQIEPGKDFLYVATYNSETKGTLKKYKLVDDPNYVEINPVENASWDGLLKIKTMNWRGGQ